MKRKAISANMKIDALMARFHILCEECGGRLNAGGIVEWDHAHPIALGGSHAFYNIRPLHPECHSAKSHGTGATTAGSDIGKISKERRIIRTKKMEVKKRKPGTRKPKSAWPSRKMQNRSFPKREKATA